MIEQLTSTIHYDADYSYYKEKLDEINVDLIKHIDASEIRANLISSVKHDIDYYEKDYKEEVQRCKENNEWAKDFLSSLKTYKKCQK